MTRQLIQRDRLGVLTKIGQGGQGVVGKDEVRVVDGLQGVQGRGAGRD